ncbi:MAG: glutamate 5-kinase [Alphaproteobacteria bacterium]|nr:glutamate 5-kinase [Alphaproteobacteria bacterium]
MDAVSAALLTSAKRIVIKIGSALLIDYAQARPRMDWLRALADDVVAARRAGQDVLIVSSGAIALGRFALGMKSSAKLEEKQAAAAAGQTRLMHAYESVFAAHDIPVAQALLTPDDTERRRRWLNGRATLQTLLDFGAVPIINENDTVATVEIRYGDNDRLAARVAQMMSADALILLSDVDGLYARDPRVDPQAPHIAEVKQVTAEIEAMAGGVNALAGVGSGGMRTKIEAAKIAAAAGCATAIAKGDEARPLQRLRDGARATWFLPSATPRQAYKAWIAGALAPAGALVVDDGAAAAVQAGKSLLPAGVVAVRGAFEKGDAVRVLQGEEEIARGLARYDADDARKIMGLKSADIESRLGYVAGPALIHADDLVTRD